MADLDARRTRVLANAAKTVQRQIRTYIARKEFLLFREAAIHLQSRCRGTILLANLSYAFLYPLGFAHFLRNILVFVTSTCFLNKTSGRLACKRYELMRREAAAKKIQKNLRRYLARKSYNLQRASAITVQTGLRTMTARNEFRFRKQTKAAIIIEVRFLILNQFCFVLFFCLVRNIFFNDHSHLSRI